MPKFRLLLLDAGVVIAAHKLGIWSQLTDKCTISLTSTVEQEVYYWSDEDGNGHQITLDSEIEQGKLQVIDVPLEQVDKFRLVFDSTYLDRMDPGESDSLAHLFYSEEDWLISSGDSIVYKILGRLHRGKQGISLEEILQQIGLGRKLDWQYTKEFRLKYTHQGERDSITGQDLK